MPTGGGNSLGILEILAGKQPLFRSTGRMQSIADIEQEFPAFINSRDESSLIGRSSGEVLLERAAVAKFRPKAGDFAGGLHGTYDSLAAARDYQLAKRGSGDLQSVRQLVISCLAKGEIPGSPFQLGECTGILLAPRTVGDNGIEVESSDTARIYLQVNNSGVWIPFSFNLAAQGNQKGDANFIAGPIATLRVQVVNPTQDTQFQPNIYLLLMRGFTVVGSFGAAVGYGPPQGVNTETGFTEVGGSGSGSGTGGSGGGTGGGTGGGGGGGGHQGGGGGGGRQNLK